MTQPHIGKVVCAIIERGTRFLVARRPRHTSFALKWEFPGGKVDPGESEESALHRELMEELGIRVYIIERLSPVMHAYPDFSLELVPFRCGLMAKQEIQALEHVDLRWIGIDEVHDFSFPDADIPVLEEYRKMLTSGGGHC
ncbi:MAG: (deoxy)nucleoside triphosphate pyrophosphohydrolase [Prosthecochloris sp.]|nr:(deoxy)nucleoside triphosphate pyrophosphohydrolase [Prosthecochloris sp.]